MNHCNEITIDTHNDKEVVKDSFLKVHIQGVSGSDPKRRDEHKLVRIGLERFENNKRKPAENFQWTFLDKPCYGGRDFQGLNCDVGIAFNATEPGPHILEFYLRDKSIKKDKVITSGVFQVVDPPKK